MKHVNFLILAMLAFCFTSSMSGQSRNSKTDGPTIQTQSEKLRTAIGWKLDALDNWISNENAISDTHLNESERYTVPQNFKWLQFALLKNGKQDLYALLYETTVYVSHTRNERRVYYFLMTAKSYGNIISTIANKTGETMTIHSSYFGYMSDSDGVYTASKLLKLIGQTISNDENLFKYDFSINVQHIDNEDVVRFLLPEKSSILSNDLQNHYFETPLVNYNKILLPISTKLEDSEFDLGEMAPISLNKDLEQSPDDGLIERNAPTPIKSNQTDFDFNSETLSEDKTTSPYSDQKQINNEDFTGMADRLIKEKAIISAPIASFSDIEGWYFNFDGEWVTDKSLSYNFETVGRYEMRNFRYCEKDYILITRFEKYAGSSFYLIQKSDYLRTVSNLDKSSILRFPVIAYANVGYTLEDMIEISEKTIDAPIKEDRIIFKNNYLVLQYKLSMQKNISRFFIYYQECSKYGSETSKENCNAKVSNKIKYDDEPLLGSDVLFNKMYYESTYNNFMNFLRKPISTTNNTPRSANNDLDLESRY